MPDDYGRKQYDDKNYADWVRNMPAKAMWNQVLEKFPGVGEYYSSIKSTPLTRSIQRYIQQSEFKKPYDDKDYRSMEEDWEGPGQTQYRPGTYDNPWNIQYPRIPFADPVAGEDWELQPGGLYNCHAWTTDCFCQGQETTITISADNPITGIKMTWGKTGTSVSLLNGIGTTTISVLIAADEDQVGWITIHVDMVTLTKTGGLLHCEDHVNIWSCPESQCCGDCSDFVLDTVSTAQTIARNSSIALVVSGGTGPYTWTLSQTLGNGFTIDASTSASTTLYADGTACGTADILVTDNCDCEVEFSIRCTTGVWQAQSGGSPSIYCNGCPDGPPYCDDTRSTGWSGSIPSKSCYPTHCKYYFTETLRRTVATSLNFSEPNAASKCEASRLSYTCTGSSCTYYGTTGMQCNECVGHPNPLHYPTNPALCTIGSAPSKIMYIQGQPAYYAPDSCIYYNLKYYHCVNCWQSVGLTRYRWKCA